MKKTFAVLVLVSMFASAAPRVPSLDLFSCSELAPGVCDVAAPYTFTGDGYNPHKDYLLVGAGREIEVIVASDGSMTATAYSGLAGTWTFTMYQLNHNGAVTKTLGSVDVTFADAP